MPHQRPWLLPELWDNCSETERLAAAREALTAKLKALVLAECIVIVGGDDGYHIECRFLRNRVGDWSYQLDCHKKPPQSIFVVEQEIQPLLDLLGQIKESHPATSGTIHGPDSRARVPCIWYHAKKDRLLWLSGFLALQDTAVALAKQINRRLDLD